MRNRRTSKTLWSRPLADLVRTAIDPVLARQGFGQTRLVLFWDEIVGERLASVSRPVKVRWPARRHDRASEDDCAPATLIVRVESGFALEMQHLASIVIERVNAYFGWRCVSRLVLLQGPVPARPFIGRVVRQADKAAEMAAETIVGNGVDEPLRQALTRLGAYVLTGSSHEAPPETRQAGLAKQ